MRLYQIFTRLYGNTVERPVPNGSRAQNGCGTLDDLTEIALARIASLGFTHIWLTGLLDHATTTDYADLGLPPATASITKGRAGSPYAIRNYFDLAPDLARYPARRWQAFEACLGRIHAAGLKLLVDFVPNHTAREYRPGKSPNPSAHDTRRPGFFPDNFYFYLDRGLKLPFAPDYKELPARATGNDAFTPTPTEQDWYETVKVNYGQDPRTGQAHFEGPPCTWRFMAEVLQFWAGKGVDGFRCDMVDMVPVPFWQWALAQAKAAHPHLLFVGESYQPHNYDPLFAAGFDLLYDKVGLYDALLHRLQGKADTGAIGKALWDTRGQDRRLLRFTENHDEPRLPSAALLGKTLPATAAFFVTAVVGRQLMVYAGQEVGEPGQDQEGFSGPDGKTTIFDYWSVGSLRRLCNNGLWDGAALLPAERQTLEAYRQILALHARLEAERLERLYNLQTANPQGYGAAALNDGLALLVLPAHSATAPLLAIANFTPRIERFTVRIPPEAGVALPQALEEWLHLSDAEPFSDLHPLPDGGFAVSATLGAYGCWACRLP